MVNREMLAVVATILGSAVQPGYGDFPGEILPFPQPLFFVQAISAQAQPPIAVSGRLTICSGPSILAATRPRQPECGLKLTGTKPALSERKAQGRGRFEKDRAACRHEHDRIAGFRHTLVQPALFVPKGPAERR